MKNMSAWDAKNEFGLMVNTAISERIIIEKHQQCVMKVTIRETGWKHFPCDTEAWIL